MFIHVFWVISIMFIISTSITILTVHYCFLQHNLCLLKEPRDEKAKNVKDF